MTEPTYLTREEAAAYAGVIDRTIDRWIRQHGLPAYKVRPQGRGGVRVKIRQDDLDAFMAPQPILRDL